ncbi:hypothetical protein HZ326_25681 [Fusarium oxysporum f. sp. albedinis]|nr:hypothetical protein HZ326_25681 [Fusarium oxysporum f. sp. albedinis]
MDGDLHDDYASRNSSYRTRHLPVCNQPPYVPAKVEPIDLSDSCESEYPGLTRSVRILGTICSCPSPATEDMLFQSLPDLSAD